MKLRGIKILITVLASLVAFNSYVSCIELETPCAYGLPKNKIKNELLKYKPGGAGQHIIAITIPKSGTHLLHKCVVLLDLKGIYHPDKNGVSQKFIEKVRALNKNPPPNHYRGLFHIPTVGPIPEGAVSQMKTSKFARSFWIHWPYTPESEKIFNHYGKSNFLMIRDPRDQLVSMVFMVYKNANGDEAPFEEALLDLIDGKQRVYIPWAVEIQTAHPLMWELGVVGFYELYTPWMNSKNFYTVKFENLIGENGEGSSRTQLREIKNIARHLGLEISTSQAKEISEQLFGGTLTFREGKIGAWKTYFTPKVKEIFKNTPGACQLLIDLGYETNSDW